MKQKYKILAFTILIIYIVILWPILQKTNLANTNVAFPKGEMTIDGEYESTEDQTDEQSTSVSTAGGESLSKMNQEIVVDLRGAVVNPGIYHMQDGARMYELIKKAGGLNNANKSCINQAQIISDESKIIIPSKGKKCNSTNPGYSSGTPITKNKVNINNADVNTLSTLTGIGDTRAQDIINYREEHGNFKNIDELKNVSGIGEQTFLKIKDLITI